MDAAALKAQAQTLNLPSGLADWLLKTLGPALLKILLDLVHKYGQAGVTMDAVGSATIVDLIITLMQNFGPVIVEDLAKALETQGGAVAALIASFVRQAGPQLLTMVEGWLKSTEGQAALAAAVAAHLAKA